jgi:Short C-terminal domain
VFVIRGGRGVKPGLASSEAAATPDWASMGGGNRGSAWSYSAPPQPVAAAPPEPENGDRITRLERLQRLRDEGVLSESEFEVEKAKVLSGL